MPETHGSGVRIRYDVAGAGEPVVLIHGYSASAQTNWRMSGCIDALAARYRVVAMDLRGHGRSEKPWRARDYSTRQLARDVLAVMDAEGIGRARIAGYSMGGMVALHLLLHMPGRVHAAVIGGMGAALPRRWDIRDTCVDCEDPGDGVAHARRLSGRFLRAYLGSFNPPALVAAYRGVLRDAEPLQSEQLGQVSTPVLCIAGSRDHMCRSARALAGEIQGARFVLLRGESHLSALGNPLLRESMLEFFASV
jgi:pimeloyl-ACP methyl ester carboxylesterase